MSKKNITTEQKLKAVIDAQVKGGMFRWGGWTEGCHISSERNKEGIIVKDGYKGECYCFILAILLDPEGLRAAYGREPRVEQNTKEKTDRALIHWIMPCWEFAARKILREWLYDGAEAAINTAYDLLP